MPDAKNHNAGGVSAHAFRTFMVTSTLPGLKNQKEPLSFVCAIAWPSPLAPSAVCQRAVTAKRPFSRHSVVALGRHAPRIAALTATMLVVSVVSGAPAPHAVTTPWQPC